MSLILPLDLPAIQLLKKENIIVPLCDSSHDKHVLHLLLLNLMPLKINTETDFVRLLSNSPLSLKIDLLKIKNHISKNTSAEHMKKFYIDFDDIKNNYYDGLIVTGAPVEKISFEEVHYWDELTTIFEWAQTHVSSSLYICWAAQAALYHFYGIPKYDLPEKMFGVFRHTLFDSSLPIFRGFDDEFYVPHSRHTEIRREDILKVPNLTLLSESDESGVYMLMARNGKDFFITGHSEYSPNTLADEYWRDKNKGLPISIPKFYFRDDDPTKEPIVRWRSHANLLFSNWLNYYVNDEACNRDTNAAMFF